MKLALLAWVPAVVCVAAAVADETPRETDDEAQIRKAIESYVTAYNAADAKALAALWSPEAVYTNPETGEQVEGRQAIEEQFAAIFEAAPGATLQVRTESIRFVSPNVAVEQGIAIFREADSDPDESGYSAVYVRRDCQWLLDRVTEESLPVVISNYEHLKALEWMIGTWLDQDDQVQVATTCQWTKNKNFIIRFFTVSVRDRIESSGMQIVGWDPAAKQIRSWVFDSDGGFGQGAWSKQGDAWYIASTGTLADGRASSATNIITPVDDNTFTWQSINRQAGGELLPNVDEVVVVRQESAE